jgi:hypothetical protein
VSDGLLFLLNTPVSSTSKSKYGNIKKNTRASKKEDIHSSLANFCEKTLTLG